MFAVYLKSCSVLNITWEIKVHVWCVEAGAFDESWWLDVTDLERSQRLFQDKDLMLKNLKDKIGAVPTVGQIMQRRYLKEK